MLEKEHISTYYINYTMKIYFSTASLYITLLQNTLPSTVVTPKKSFTTGLLIDQIAATWYL